MENLLHIGAKVDKESTTNTAEAITSLMKTAFETRASDAVLLKALGSLERVLSVENLSITNCTFDATKKNTVEITVQDDIEVKENT